MSVAQVTLLNVDRDRNGVATNIRELMERSREPMLLIQPDRSPLLRRPAYRKLRAGIDYLASRARNTAVGDLACLIHLALRFIELRSVMRMERAKISTFHAHDVFSALAALRAKPRVPCAMSCHFWTMPYHEFARAGLVRRRKFAWRVIRTISLHALRSRDIRRISLSRAAARKLQRLLRLPQMPTVIYPPTGSSGKAIRSVRRKNGAPFRICVVGTIEERKMQRRVPNISARLAERGASVEFLLIGNDQNEEGVIIRDRILNLGQSERVRLLGAVAPLEVNALLAESDLFLQLSPNESFGIAVIEAARCGLPALAVEYPALREILGPDSPGIISRSLCDDEIAAKIYEWISNREFLQGVGLENRRIYFKKFRTARFHKAHREIYSELRPAQSEFWTK